MKLPLTFLLLSALCLAVLPALAQDRDIYDNGPTNGTTDAWTINFGFTVSNSFTVTSNSDIIDGLAFAVWLNPGDVLQSAEISISSQEFGGISYFDDNVTFTQSNCVSNQFGLDVCTETGRLNNGGELAPGTYWLNIQSATVNSGNPVYWDENSGPSSASQNELGTIPSESFTIFARGGTESGTGTTPEPSSVVLFGSGILGVANLLRRRLH